MSNILSWIRTHILIVVFIAIIVVSLPSLFVVAEGMNRSVSEKLASRVRNQNNALDRVSKTNVQIEPLLPGAPTFDEQMVVNDAVLERYREIREAIKSDADALLSEAVAINSANKRDDLLVPDLLPKPPAGYENELPFRIHGEYMAAHDDLLAHMNAGPAIDPDALAQALDDFQSTYIRTQLNREPGDPLVDEDTERLAEAMTTRRMIEYRQHAEALSVYADMDVFNLETWDNTPPPPGKWFDWQHVTWVHHDLAEAIRRANSVDGEGGGGQLPIAGSESSVVKRIISVTVYQMFDVRARKDESIDQGMGDDSFGFMAEGGEGTFMMEGQAMPMGKGGGGKGMRGGYEGGGPSGGSGGPAVIDNSDPSVEFQSDFAVSMSGRAGNPLYDVRIMSVELIVDSARIPTLLHAINSSNFNTVTGCNIKPVDVLGELSMGYFYGSDPVVQLSLEIETIWLRDWTEPLMPDDVKSALNIETDDEDQGSMDDQGTGTEGLERGRGEFDRGGGGG